MCVCVCVIIIDNLCIALFSGVPKLCVCVCVEGGGGGKRSGVEASTSMMCRKNAMYHTDEFRIWEMLVLQVSPCPYACALLPSPHHPLIDTRKQT